MALKKIRLVWSTPALPEGRWRLGLYNFQPFPGPVRTAASLRADALPSYWKSYLHHALHLSVRGLLAWSLAFALAAYFAGAALLLQRLERANPHNRVRYGDLINPARWSQIEALRGEGLVLQGRELLKRGEFANGFGLLRLGLERNPADFSARLDVARLYAALRLRAPGEKLLLDGLAFGYPGRDYLQFAFDLAADADRTDDWAALALRARESFAASPSSERPGADALWLDQQCVRALRAAGRADEALALVEAAYPEDHAFRREIAVLHRLESTRPVEAAALAEAWAAASPRAPEPLRVLVRAHREARDFTAMDAALGRLRALEPAKPEALLYAIAQNHLAGRPEAARAALEELLFRHGATAAVYAPTAAMLVELRQTEALDRLERELRERGLPLRPIHEARLRLAVTTRDWPTVLAGAEDLRADGGSPGSGPADVRMAWLDTITRLARACIDGASGTQASLVETVADHPGTLRLYKLILEALLDSGRPATARQILTLAEGPYQNARAILALRGRIESALASASPAAPGPAPAGPAELASFPALSSAFEARIKINDTEGALGLLASARRLRPDWFAAAEPRLDAIEFPLRAAGDDPLRLQFLARAILSRDSAAPGRLLTMARELHDKSPAHRSNALLIVREIVRHSPEHPDAIAQLADWEAGPPRAPVDVTP